ncbi:VOC family protein [Janibacter limosus]|uniref:VOC family protein n=1 Tax=Janibacter limosus TaxID=53458 RepID=UPI00082D6342|nr:VOC family protein [Janibacter limosus]
MKVHGLAWLGSSSPALEEMTAFIRDGLGLEVQQEQEGARVFGFPDGSAFEIFKPSDDAHDFFEHPVAGFLVDDVAEVRAHLESRGVEFVGEIHEGVEDSWSPRWTHFRGPDGYLYGLVTSWPEQRVSRDRGFDELRFCLRVDDFDTALAQYRDGLGMQVVDEWTHPDGQRGALFGVVPAALEIFDGPQADLVDAVEAGEPLGRDHGLRVEVADLPALERLAGVLEASGATRHATGVVETPWEQTCQRMDLPDGEQLTISILPASERAERTIARARINL